MSWIRIICSLILFVVAVSCVPQPRVVGGIDSDIKRFPFMVSLRRWNGAHACGGTLLSPNWVLTAAHCVAGSSPRDWSVQYASTSIHPNAFFNVISLRRIVVHEGYSPPDSYANDIALIELNGRLLYNYDTLAPVQLPEMNYEIPQLDEGVTGVLIGYGYDETGKIQRNLQEVDLKIYSDEECQSRHGGQASLDHICAGVDEGGKGQCSGDSGGPLLYMDSIQLGIVSWSVKPCTKPGYPGVYTKVSHYVDWIKKIILDTGDTHFGAVADLPKICKGGLIN